MIIQSKKVWIGSSFIPAQLELKNEKISRVLKWSSGTCNIDYDDNRILPGFIDVHTHGAYGFDTNDADEEGLRYWLSHIASEGITSIMPTTTTQHPEALKKALKNVSDVIKSGYEGAEILGIHFEGPYIDEKYKGAQSPEAIAVPSVDGFKEYQSAADGCIKYITMSPTKDNDYNLIRYCAQNGIRVGLGHSEADYEDVIMAMANGASSITHTYNGMPPFHHRSLGMTGAALTENDLYGEIICDGLHSDLEALRLFFQAKGAYRAIMITDSLSAKHSEKVKPCRQTLRLGGQEIELDNNGLARLCKSGTIAGSTLKMNEGLRLLIEEAGVPREYAINSCTINPARYLGTDNRKGKICAGYDADLVVLGKDYEVLDTYCKALKWGKNERD